MGASGYRRKLVAVSFAAFDSDPYPRDSRTGWFLEGPTDDPAGWGPTLRAIADRRSDLFGRLSDWYYLCHPASMGGARVAGRSSEEVGRDTQEALQRHVPLEARPRFQLITWDTSRPPNDHADLWEFVKKQLRRIRGAHEDAELVLALSSGTAAMHAVLLLAGSVGIIEGPLRLVQVERNEGARLRAARPVVDVTLKVDTVLQVTRRTKPAGVLPEEALTVGYDQATSPALRRAVELARRAARVPFPVLLRGERGVGKSHMARFIRACSSHRVPARDSEWPALACGQFSDPSRLMVELCGSVKGAFTGAEDRAGLLALADQDTLFLDEIHDLVEANQRALMRIIEDREYRRLGSKEPLTSRFRLITGTNLPDRELRARLAPDFYDRIRDIEIKIPPLRECREDLPWIWQAAWQHVAARALVDANALERHMPSIVRALEKQELLGNWRDLRRLAVAFAIAVRANDELDAKTVAAMVQEFFASENHDDDGESAIVKLSARDRTNLRKLEATLGAGLERFWAACDGQHAPRVVLTDLLGTRHRAAHAENFIQKIFPARWEAILGHGTRRR